MNKCKMNLKVNKLFVHRRKVQIFGLLHLPLNLEKFVTNFGQIFFFLKGICGAQKITLGDE